MMRIYGYLKEKWCSCLIVASNISLHLKNISKTGELTRAAVAGESSVTGTDVKNYKTKEKALRD
jgi:hypothetical protein